MKKLLTKSIYFGAMVLGTISCNKDFVEQNDSLEIEPTALEAIEEKVTGVSEETFLEVLQNKNSRLTQKIPEGSFIKNFNLDKGYYTKDKHQEVLSIPVKSFGSTKISFLSIDEKQNKSQYILIYPDSTNNKRFYIANLQGELIKRVVIDEFGMGHDEYLDEGGKTKRTQVCTKPIYVRCSSGKHSFEKGNGWECTYWDDLSKGTPPQVFQVETPCNENSSGGGGEWTPPPHPSWNENTSSGGGVSIPSIRNGNSPADPEQCASGFNCPSDINKISFHEYVAKLSEQDRKFINHNFRIRNGLRKLASINGVDANLIDFINNLKQTFLYMTDDVLLALFDEKYLNPNATFEQCFTLAVVNEMTSALTADPIELYLLLRYQNSDYFDVSAFSIGSDSIEVGEYTLTPHYTANGRLVFYTAARYQNNGLKNDIEYVIKPEGLQRFKDKIDTYTATANIFYLNGIPSESQIALAAGDYVEGLTKMWGEALHSAEWWFSSITILADAVVSPFLKTSLPKNQQRLNQHFQKWQSAKNNLPAHHVRDINVLWADYGYITRKLFDNAKNIFKATDDEIAQAAERIQKVHLENKRLKGKNLAYIEGVTNKGVVDNKIWNSVSLEIAESELHIFEAINATSTKGNTWLRITDSEYRMLNDLAKDLGAKQGGVYPHITGEIKIVSEFKYCDSCTGVIQQFNKMFPNIKLILVDGIK
ncbi:deaminase domain-containing protein [Capnocytophaga canimorsus]|uniref:deaminase domain-containing protein n=1 Tax=Capnocytophaga canimorsus TaxID=28188 RepID=UPI000F710E40|nr:deaminase domain-containing protein [Capnocytophaga canimorsus]VEJ19064.1 Uncharacterised protein [Capnocytophaga canimorsus]